MRKSEELKKKNVARLALALVIILLTFLAAASGVSFAKMYGEGESNGAPSSVAVPVAKGGFKNVYRTDAAGKRESVAFDGDDSSLTIRDVEPNDVLDVFYYITDAEGNQKNEVLLKATVTVGVRLEMIPSETGVHITEYFAGWKEYGEDDGVKNGGLLEVYGVFGAKENEIRASKSSTGKVDYSGGTLFVETDEESGAISNKFGIYLEPSGYASEYVYHFRFTLPKQNAETESYAGARLYMDINALFEQSAGR